MLLILVAGAATLALAQDNVLDNGPLRLTVDPHAGTFTVSAQRLPDVYSYDAGPRLQMDGQTVSPSDATGVVVHCEPFTDRVSRGNKVVVSYSSKAAPSLRYESGFYAEKRCISATGYLSQGSYHLSDFSVVYGKVRTTSAFKTRVYINAGHTGGDSGVWPLGEKNWASDALSSFYDPGVREAINLGFYSFQRASTSVDSQYAGGDEIRANAAAHYHGYQPRIARPLLRRVFPQPVKPDWFCATYGTTQSGDLIQESLFPAPR